MKKMNWWRASRNRRNEEAAEPKPQRHYDSTYVRIRSGPVRTLAGMSPEKRAEMERLYGGRKP